jgi:hypothetical protein
MLMKEDLAQLVIESVKTQTRRPIKAGERLIELDGVKTVMSADGKRIKYQVGREYSLQYGRGLPTRLFRDNDAHLLPLAEYLKWQGVKGDYNGVSADVLSVNEYIPLKIKLLDVWAEDVRTITRPESEAEGFSCAEEFLVTWCDFYAKRIDAKWWSEHKLVEWYSTIMFANGHYISHEFEVPGAQVANFSAWLIKNSADNLYQAWALEFEVVKP